MINAINFLLAGSCILMAQSEHHAIEELADAASQRIVNNDVASQRIVNNDVGNELSRNKRAVPSAVKGLAAAKTLLKGVKDAGARDKYHAYKKTGDLQTAFTDFHSVKPAFTVLNKHHPHEYTSLKTNRDYSRFVGMVGDRSVILWLNGDRYSKGKPVLEISSASGDVPDRITYGKGSAWYRRGYYKESY